MKKGGETLIQNINGPHQIWSICYVFIEAYLERIEIYISLEIYLIVNLWCPSYKTLVDMTELEKGWASLRNR